MQKCQTKMFADNTFIYHGNSLPNQSLQDAIINASNCFHANKLTINATKYEKISIGTSKNSAICINQTKFANKKSCKYLDLHLDGRLNFVHRIEKGFKKLNKYCGRFYRTRNLYSRQFRLMFYKFFAKSIIIYVLLAYGSAKKSNLIKIEKAQNRILRAIFFPKKNGVTQEYFVREQDLDSF